MSARLPARGQSTLGRRVAPAGGASLAKLALAQGLNANMLHTWRRGTRGKAAGAERKTEFGALPLAMPVPSSGTTIRIELRQGATSSAVA